MREDEVPLSVGSTLQAALGGFDATRWWDPLETLKTSDIYLVLFIQYTVGIMVNETHKAIVAFVELYVWQGRQQFIISL